MSTEYNIESVNNGYVFRDYGVAGKYDSIRSVYTNWADVVARITNNPLELNTQAD